MASQETGYIDGTQIVLLSYAVVGKSATNWDYGTQFNWGDRTMRSLAISFTLLLLLVPILGACIATSIPPTPVRLDWLEVIAHDETGNAAAEMFSDDEIGIFFFVAYADLHITAESPISTECVAQMKAELALSPFGTPENVASSCFVDMKLNVDVSYLGKYDIKFEGMSDGSHATGYLQQPILGSPGYSRLIASSHMGFDTYKLDALEGTQVDATYPAIIVVPMIYELDGIGWSKLSDQAEEKVKQAFFRTFKRGIPYRGMKYVPDAFGIMLDSGLKKVVGWDESDEFFHSYIQLIELIVNVEGLSELFSITKAEYLGTDVIMFLHSAYKPGVAHSWVRVYTPYESKFGIWEGFTGDSGKYELRFLFSTKSDPPPTPKPGCPDDEECCWRYPTGECYCVPEGDECPEYPDSMRGCESGVCCEPGPDGCRTCARSYSECPLPE